MIVFICAVIFIGGLIILIAQGYKNSDPSLPKPDREWMPTNSGPLSQSQILSDIPNQGGVRRKKSDTPVKRHFEIEYIDQEGDQTKRNVFIHFMSTDEYQRENLWCYCYLRNDHRTFFVHKILSMTDLTTGQIVPDKIEYLKSIASDS